MNRKDRLRYALRSGARDTATVTQVIGVLYLAGSGLAIASVLLPHPQVTNAWAIAAIAGLATVVGAASLLWADLARPWMVHAALAAGTSLVSLCVYFAGVASGVYSLMFIWVVLLAASFLTRRAVAFHVAWIVVAWGLALALVEERTGFAGTSRWLLGCFVLIVTAVVMAEIVSGRRLTEIRLGMAAHLANHDPLTGLPNRRLVDMTLDREMSRTRRHGTPLSLVALDLDRFKEYNDEHGHSAGDQLLKAAATAWANELSAEDLIARIGGDEFLVLLPGCSLAEALQAAERLLDSLPDGCSGSAGVASWVGEESTEELLGRVDQALYRTKSKSRLANPGST